MQASIIHNSTSSFESYSKKIGFLFVFLWSTLGGLFAQHQQPLDVDFTEIDSVQYLEFQKAYRNNLVIDSIEHAITRSSFTLFIRNEEEQYECPTEYNDCNYYKGFLPAINSHVISNCGVQVCYTYLLNRTSGDYQTLFSSFDTECEVPLLSKDLTKMLAYASSAFDAASYLSVYERANAASQFNYQNFKGIEINSWVINEAIWVNDTTFALITSETYGGSDVSVLVNVKYRLGRVK
jgi:hypothetical protein